MVVGERKEDVTGTWRCSYVERRGERGRALHDCCVAGRLQAYYSEFKNGNWREEPVDAAGQDPMLNP